jgi:hypothetical protein
VAGVGVCTDFQAVQDGYTLMAMVRTSSLNPVQFRVLLPKKLMVKNMIAPIRDANIKAAKEMGVDLEKVTKKWKGDKPRIQTEAKLVPASVPPATGFHSAFTASAWPRDDGSKGYSKWMWLDEGTKVRYATMTKGFVPKTRVGQLNSWVGKVKLLFISKKRPRPGIKARKFTLALRKKWEKPYRAAMEKAVEKAAKASGHAV